MQHSSAETPPNRLSKHTLLTLAEIIICIDSQPAALALQFTGALQLAHLAASLKWEGNPSMLLRWLARKQTSLAAAD
jgi:hypothetical protein